MTPQSTNPPSVPVGMPDAELLANCVRDPELFGEFYPVIEDLEAGLDTPGAELSVRTLAQSMMERQNQTAMNHLVAHLAVFDSLSLVDADLPEAEFHSQDEATSAKASLRELCGLMVQLRQDPDASDVLRGFPVNERVSWQSTPTGSGLGFITMLSLVESRDGTAEFRAISTSYDPTDPSTEPDRTRTGLMFEFLGGLS